MDLPTGKVKGETQLTQPLCSVRASIVLGFQSGFYCLLIGILTAIQRPSPIEVVLVYLFNKS